MSRSAGEFSGQLVSSRMTLMRPIAARQSRVTTWRPAIGTVTVSQVPSALRTGSTGRSRGSWSLYSACCTPSLSTTWVK